MGPQTAQELLLIAERRGGGEITREVNPGLMEIIERCQGFFSLNVKVFGYPNCGTRACAAGVLVDLDRIKAKATEVEEKLVELEELDQVHRIFDPSSLVWYAVAHEFAHCLQSRRVAWKEMEARPLPHEVSADYLAGVLIGCLVAEFDINFLNVIDTAWEIGRKCDADPHPPPKQRHAAMLLGVQNGGTCGIVQPTSLQLDKMLDRSYEVSLAILEDGAE